MAFIELYEVSKSYGSHRAVGPFALEIETGQLVAIVGPSGCGKTTLLRIIAGLEGADVGLLRVGGEVITDVPPDRRGIGFVFQEFSLYPHMTVRENLAFPLRAQHLKRSQIASRVGPISEMLEIEALLDRYPSQLSGGQRQRVAIGRAIIRQPRVLLLDEPLSQLDAVLRVRLRDVLVQLHGELGATTLLVTHDATEAMAIADRVVVMCEGQILQDASPSEVYARPASRFVAEFFGDPPMNLWPARLDAGMLCCNQQRIPLGCPETGSPRGGRDVWVGFRPAGVRRLAGETGAAGRNENRAGLRVRATVVRSYRDEDRVVVTGEAAGHPLAVVLSQADAPAVGDVVDWIVPLDSLHLFDASPGDLSCPGGIAGAGGFSGPGGPSGTGGGSRIRFGN